MYIGGYIYICIYINRTHTHTRSIGGGGLKKNGMEINKISNKREV